MDGRVKLANALMKQRNYGPAEQVLSQHLSQRPNDPEAVYLYGTMYFRQGNDVQAEAMFRRLIALSPQDAQAYYSLGMTLSRMGRVSEAAQSLQTALQVDPGHARARQALNGLTSTAPDPNDGKKDEDAHLTPGAIVASGSRRLSSYAGQFAAALITIALGAGILATYRAGRLQSIADGPPFQWPSVDFLRDRFATTGQDEHRRELESAIARVDSISGALDAATLVVAATLIAIGLGLIMHALFAAPSTKYRIYERRIDVTSGVLSRRRMSAWLYEIVDVELRQSPMLTLSGNAEVRVYLPPTGQTKRSRFHDRSTVRIVGFGSVRFLEGLWAEIRDAGLRERRVMRKWYL